jgi:hypothetical protein
MMEVGMNNFLQLPYKWSPLFTSDIYKYVPLKDSGNLVRNTFQIQSCVVKYAF